jgi:hypothetical protein
MFIHVRLGAISLPAGFTDRTFTPKDIGVKFRADISINSAPKKERELRVEGVDLYSGRVYVSYCDD